jgi:hypothetical protein
MKNANAVLPEEQATATVDMNIIIDTGTGVGISSLETILLPWNQVTDLVWTIATPGFKFTSDPVALPESFPLKFKSLIDNTLTLTFNNTIERQPGSFSFTLLTQSDQFSEVVRVDPTVENDPPPPRTVGEKPRRPRHHLKVAGPAAKGGAR